MSLSDKNRLDYTLSMLRRAVDARLSWPVSPAEAAALLAEVEHLRADNERYGSQLEAAHDRGVAEERAAVVAYLRSQAEVFVDDERALCRAATIIERGEHRREEDK